jgi:hypothetical protein
MRLPRQRGRENDFIPYSRQDEKYDEREKKKLKSKKPA